MENKKHLNDLDVWETKQILGDSKVCTLYNVSSEFFRTEQGNNISRETNHLSLQHQLRNKVIN